MIYAWQVGSASAKCSPTAGGHSNFFCSGLQLSIVFTVLNSKLSLTNSLVEELGIESGRSLMYRRKMRRHRMVSCDNKEIIVQSLSGRLKSPVTQMCLPISVKEKFEDCVNSLY